MPSQYCRVVTAAFLARDCALVRLMCVRSASHMHDSLPDFNTHAGVDSRSDLDWRFPNEVLKNVLRHVDAINLGKSAGVEKAWRDAAEDDAVWKHHALAAWQGEAQIATVLQSRRTSHSRCSYKSLYLLHRRLTPRDRAIVLGIYCPI